MKKKATAKTKVKDLKPKKNPKGGGTIGTVSDLSKRLMPPARD